MAFVRREAVAMLDARKLAIITGLWANDGLNDDKGTRSQRLEELEAQFQDAVDKIWIGETRHDDERITKEDEENPFLKPAIEAARSIEQPRNDEGTVGEAIASGDLTIDQE